MSVQITVRNVPQAVRDELASRAASQGKSMQEFLRSELVRIASRPALADWLTGVRERKGLAPKRVPPEEILQQLRAERR